jgi:ankyrin repeat protein
MIKFGWNSMTPLHNSCARNNLEVVKYLISIGCDKNAKNNKGETPLYIAKK